MDAETRARLAAQPISDTLRPSTSARRLLDAARGFHSQVTGDPSVPLDVRHLMAAYVYRPAGHEVELADLGFDRAGWAAAFLAQMAVLYPAEHPSWVVVHHLNVPAPASAAPAAGAAEVAQEKAPLEAAPAEPTAGEATPAPVVPEGPSTHIATDIWTLDDALGYRAYAHAIYRFMTHPQTRPPLTISIQAPWGGGKTSLMRMIQQALDPEALGAVQRETGRPRGAFTVREALEEIRRWIDRTPDERTRDLPRVPDDPGREMLTVWFNAWKYESTKEVWAGLVDALMQQVAARLPVRERELFWLRLNLRRVDADRLRHRIHERIFRYWRRGLLRWLLPFAVVLLVAVAAGLLGVVPGAGTLGAAFSVAGSLAAALAKFFKEREKVRSEPAEVSLGDYLDIPDYAAELGFLHHVEADLRRVLASLPARVDPATGRREPAPIVVFIDDLDRCSPAKVAQVVEAVNLFLGGDFPNCMFVMGMDAEMVAAALQAAHRDLIACLPPDAGIPVGWRFMDKFVQLPFIIPPVQRVDRYTDSLFSWPVAPPDPVVDAMAAEAAAQVTGAGDAAEAVRVLQEEKRLDETQAAQLRDRLEAQVVRRRLDEGISQFRDGNQKIREAVAAAAPYFQANPREMKRFVNAFRFNYFLWWAHRAQGFEAPALDQLVRWTALSMKWPEVARWLRRSNGSDWHAPEPGAGPPPPLPTRLRLLEQLGGQAVDLPSWQAGAAAQLRLDPAVTPWLQDDDLLQFFHAEAHRPEGQRLSDGAGKGLW